MSEVLDSIKQVEGDAFDANSRAGFPRGYSPPDWLPYWRDPARYTDHGDDLRLWAWEFLRRNPEYQSDYAHYMSIPWCYPEGGKTPKIAARSIGYDSEMIYLHGSLPAIPGETAGEYEHRTGEWPIPLEEHLLEKWQIMTLNDPAGEAAPHYGPDDRAILPQAVNFAAPYFDCGPRAKNFHGLEWMEGRLMVPDWPPEIDGYVSVFAFDLRRNIDDQIDDIRARLKELQNEAKQPPDDNEFNDYPPIEYIARPKTKFLNGILNDLRILDAVWSGASWMDIATNLWGGPKKSGRQDGGQFEDYDKKKMEQRIKDANSRSRARIDRGYREMLLWSEMQQSPKNKKNKVRQAA